MRLACLRNFQQVGEQIKWIRDVLIFVRQLKLHFTRKCRNHIICGLSLPWIMANFPFAEMGQTS